MKQDVFGQMNTLTHPTTVEAWDGVLLGFMAHAADTPQHLDNEPEHAPDFALGHAVKGLLIALPGRREVLQPVRKDAQRIRGDTPTRMSDPCLATIKGPEAHGDDLYGAAFDVLPSVRSDMQMAGGSHAQRDVSERITIDSGLRAGRLDAVERILDDRRAKRAGAEDNYALARRALISAARDNGDAQRVPAE